jgi:hypothetical protein
LQDFYLEQWMPPSVPMDRQPLFTQHLMTEKNDTIKATLSGFFLFNSYPIAAVHAISGLTASEIFTIL